ncbi:glycoside hydrolase family protein [Undibacterium squillarum]|uniref:Lysozyme n=1 Tax=Undibacterium squillarum TaxID=1131567 RepID=A0ABQ2Y0J7_9BURK|nr:glycoside hydrolase family protein [Undibacterium squillarum]GGX43073.1 lysozyme [Undibacterium squillarum]
MNTTELAKQLRIDEGVRSRMYKDSVGKWTVGVGRNIEDNGLRDNEIELMLQNDIADVEKQLDRALPWWRSLSDVRQQALANMCFNLGIAKLLTFKTTLSHLQAGRYSQAADSALASLWAVQVGQRAQRIAEQIRKG